MEFLLKYVWVCLYILQNIGNNEYFPSTVKKWKKPECSNSWLLFVQFGVYAIVWPLVHLKCCWSS